MGEADMLRTKIRELVQKMMNSALVTGTRLSPGILSFMLTLSLHNSYFGDDDRRDDPQLAALAVIWVYILIFTWSLGWTSFFNQRQHCHVLFMTLPSVLPILSVMLTCVCIWDMTLAKSMDDCRVQPCPQSTKEEKKVEVDKENNYMIVQFALNIFFLIILSYAIHRGASKGQRVEKSEKREEEMVLLEEKNEKIKEELITERPMAA